MDESLTKRYKGQPDFQLRPICLTFCPFKRLGSIYKYLTWYSSISQLMGLTCNFPLNNCLILLKKLTKKRESNWLCTTIDFYSIWTIQQKLALYQNSLWSLLYLILINFSWTAFLWFLFSLWYYICHVKVATRR